MALHSQSIVHLGDCLDVLAAMPPASVDACITDPPYGIGTFGVEDWDRSPPPARAWAEVRRVLKPGAPLAVMTARRLYHRVATDLEGRGCAIQDMIVWLYGDGRPAATVCARRTTPSCSR